MPDLVCCGDETLVKVIARPCDPDRSISHGTMHVQSRSPDADEAFEIWTVLSIAIRIVKFLTIVCVCTVLRLLSVYLSVSTVSNYCISICLCRACRVYAPATDRRMRDRGDGFVVSVWTVYTNHYTDYCTRIQAQPGARRSTAVRNIYYLYRTLRDGHGMRSRFILHRAVSGIVYVLIIEFEYISYSYAHI